MSKSSLKIKNMRNQWPTDTQSIDQDTQPNVSLSNIEGKKALTDILRTYAEEKNIFNLDLKIYKENYFDINVHFQ